MLKINFEIDGRSVTPASLGDVLQSAVLKQIGQTIHSRLAGIRDPETGEFPTVAVRGSSLENLSFVVSSSPKLIEIVRQRLGRDFGSTNEVANATMRDEIREAKPSPVAFLSYASENKELATRIAEDLQRHGVDTFFAGWEIRPGESIRAKIPPSATSLFRRSPSIIAVPPG